jgi:spore maturation protein CgeB
MRVLCALSKHNYGVPDRGEGYEYTNFVPALRRLGHEVVLFESGSRSCYSDFRDLNRSFLHVVKDVRPNVILAAQMLYEIWLETWQIIRDSGIAATVNWATDDSWKYAQFSRFVAPAFHAFTTTYPAVYERYRRDGISHILLTQWAASAASLQPPLPAAQCTHGVSFVGTAHGSRPAWVNALRRGGIEVTCFGHGWPRGPVAADDIPRIIRSSVISLNLANGVMIWEGLVPRRINQIKARTFEVPGAGGFLLTEWTDGLDRYYAPGQEIAIFRSLDELADKIHYYLANSAERDAIARAGYERTRLGHTYDQRLAEVLDFALRQREEYNRLRGAPPTGQIDWSKFARAAEGHRMDRKLSLFRRALVAGCSTIWGPKRGQRAARRLVFELSWRLAGARTYSASGWPGRMFYGAS